MYIVIRDFNDAQDNKYAYHVGDIFPHDGRYVPENRIQDLASGRNFQRVPLIAKVNGKVEKENENVEKVAKENAHEVERVAEEKSSESTWTAEDIKKMPYMKLKSVAKQYGVEVKEREASDVRAELIEKLGL